MDEQNIVELIKAMMQQIKSIQSDIKHINDYNLYLDKKLTKVINSLNIE